MEDGSQRGRRPFTSVAEARRSALLSVMVLVLGGLTLLAIVWEAFVFADTGFSTIRDPLYRKLTVIYGILQGAAIIVALTQLDHPSRWRRAVSMGCAISAPVSVVFAFWVLATQVP